MIKPFIIGISGESGVGKSSIAEIVTLFYGKDNILTISTDDLHKWERGNHNWKNFTHLNPEANNIELGDMHLKYLSEGRFIYRSIYNHDTGNFNPPIKICPKPIIIIEGLHAFYSDLSKELIDLKIFINTDESLRTHWKIIRDTEERSYKYNEVLEALNKRKNDSDKLRKSQIEFADVIINIGPEKAIKVLGDKSEEIDLVVSLENKGSNEDKLFKFIENYINEYNKFIKSCSYIGEKLDLCQSKGGNLSVKIDQNLMIIKSSGIELKNVYKNKGYSIVNYKKVVENVFSIKDDPSLNYIISKNYEGKKPSMEVGFHLLLKKYIIHCHPIYLTGLLCLHESRKLLEKIFLDLEYEYIEYKNPGHCLFEEIKKTELNKDIYFLENHGLIISSDNIDLAVFMVDFLNTKTKEYFGLPDFNLDYAKLETTKYHVFPDSIVLDDLETRAAQNYILENMSKVGSLRYLIQDDVSYIENMEAEKYRKLC